MKERKITHWARNGGSGSFAIERLSFCGKHQPGESVIIMGNRVTCDECKRVRKAELPAIQERQRKRMRIAKMKGLITKGINL